MWTLDDSTLTLINSVCSYVLIVTWHHSWFFFWFIFDSFGSLHRLDKLSLKIPDVVMYSTEAMELFNIACGHWMNSTLTLINSVFSFGELAFRLGVVQFVAFLFSVLQDWK